METYIKKMSFEAMHLKDIFYEAGIRTELSGREDYDDWYRQGKRIPDTNMPNYYRKVFDISICYLCKVMLYLIYKDAGCRYQIKKGLIC